MIFNSEPCFKKTFPDVYYNETPVPAFVIIALVAGFTLNYIYYILLLLLQHILLQH
jgi:hypothetical protein